MRYLLALLLPLFLATPFIASANVTSVSSSPSYADSFIFYCDLYKHPFEASKHYMPRMGIAGDRCFYSLPATISGQKSVALYRGTVGNATPIAIDSVSGFAASATFISQTPNNIPTNAANDENFFAVVYGSSLGSEFTDYLSSGGTLPAEAIQNQNFYILPWKWGPKPAEEFDPVIIIPGILGSWQKNGEWVIDPILHTYDNLIDTFLANGYIRNETLFTFPYEWRNSNIDTAYQLKQKIEDVKEICDCKQVDLIGHSMGGLVAMQYIERSDYANDVDQLFLVASPLSGAPLAYKAWEGGEFEFGDTFQNLFLTTMFKNEARKNGYGVGFSSIYNYIHGRPVSSIQELLPVFHDYLSTATTTLEYPSGYPVNNFLETLISKSAKVFRDTRTEMLAADNYPNMTVSGFLVETYTPPLWDSTQKWEHGKPIETYLDGGDGTVPASSISLVTEPEVTYYETNHNGIASTSAPYLFKKLNNKEAGTVVGKVYGTDIRFLLLNLFSPIDMQIVAPDGKRLGKDFTTGAELDEIPDAFYTGFNTEDEYAIILNPLPGTYKVETVGTGSGTYTIVADYAGPATTTSAEISGTTTLGKDTSYNLFVSSTSTQISITENVPPPVQTELTPATCLIDLQKAYENKWITKKAVYTGLVADCKTLGNLLEARTKVKSKLLQLPINIAIRALLTHMDVLAKDKGNIKDGVELIHRYTTWFREHEL